MHGATLLAALLAFAGFSALADDKDPHRAAHAKIAAALEKPVVVDFVESPLSDVLEFFAEYTAIKITFDAAVKKEANSAVNVTAEAKLKDVLKQILEPKKLAYEIKDGKLVIIRAKAPKPKPKEASPTRT